MLRDQDAAAEASSGVSSDISSGKKFDLFGGFCSDLFLNQGAHAKAYWDLPKQLERLRGKLDVVHPKMF